MKLKALLLAVTRLESEKKEEVTKSGIIIPIGITTVSNVPLKGRVEHIGPGLPGIPMEIKVGDVVLYRRDAIITEVDGFDLLEQGMLIQIESEEISGEVPFDEQGFRKSKTNVQERWDLNKARLKDLGSDSPIKGFCIHPSTAEDMDKSERERERTDRMKLTEVFNRFTKHWISKPKESKENSILFMINGVNIEFLFDNDGNLIDIGATKAYKLEGEE